MTSINTVKPISSAKISPKGQVSIPKKVRELMEAKLGDIIIFYQNEKGEVVITAKFITVTKVIKK